MPPPALLLQVKAADALLPKCGWLLCLWLYRGLIEDGGGEVFLWLMSNVVGRHVPYKQQRLTTALPSTQRW
jgi:hypothetical protein